MADLVSIGRFARLTGLSIGALRHYDEVGLLRPARTDPDSGYRLYREDQLPQARAIQRLRALDLSLDEIRDVLADGDVAALRTQARRVQARIWRLQRVQYRLNALIDGTEDLMAEPKTGIEVDHRQLGVELFNYAWTLLEKDERTKAEDDEMLNATHASAYHWSRATDAPENQARAQWQIARVNAVLGRGDAAVYHAQRCLDYCLENEIRDWDLAAAYEALARGHLVAGNDAEYRRNLGLGNDALAAIADEEDRVLIGKDLAELAR
jgi:DNA-binding transcriptional MerR regulator